MTKERNVSRSCMRRVGNLLAKNEAIGVGVAEEDAETAAVLTERGGFLVNSLLYSLH